MALTQPFINSFPAFDATVGTTIYLSILGGDSITHYSFAIYSNDGSTVPLYTSQRIAVSDLNSGASIRTEQIMLRPQIGGIANNSSYKIAPTTYVIQDGNVVESAVGQATLFTCYATPTVNLQYQTLNAQQQPVFVDFGETSTTLPYSNNTILVTFNKINNNSPAQPNKVILNLYGVNADGSRDFVKTSGEIYSFSFDGVSTYTSQITLSGFVVNLGADGSLLPAEQRLYSSYQLEYECTTLENTKISGTITNINCYYPSISNTAYLNVNNLCNKGIIEINCSLTSIEGTSNVTPIYINDTEINLTQGAYGKTAWVQWSQYFALNQPYTLKMWLRDLDQGLICSLTDATNSNRFIKLEYNEETDDGGTTYGFVSLSSGITMNIDGTVSDGVLSYYIESERIALNDPTSPITSDTNLFLAIQQQEGLFDIVFKTI